MLFCHDLAKGGASVELLCAEAEREPALRAQSRSELSAHRRAQRTLFERI